MIVPQFLADQPNALLGFLVGTATPAHSIVKVGEGGRKKEVTFPEGTESKTIQLF